MFLISFLCAPFWLTLNTDSNGEHIAKLVCLACMDLLLAGKYSRGERIETFFRCSRVKGHCSYVQLDFTKVGKKNCVLGLSHQLLVQVVSRAIVSKIFLRNVCFQPNTINTIRIKSIDIH